jgi:hypothetical protein
MMQVLRIEVEPLSEQRWAKIERSLFARLEREADELPSFARKRSGTSPRWWLAAAAAVAAVVVALVVHLAPEQHAAVEMPSRITTGADTSHLALSGLAVDVEPDSAVVVGPETPQGMLIVVDRGGIVCEVAPRPSGAPVIVQAGAARVRVLGTRFSVSRRGESARVSVEHGVVEVSAHGQSVRVRAGEEWPAKEADRRATTDQVPEAASTGAGTEGAQRSATLSERRAPKVPPASGRGAEDPAPASSRQGVFEQAAALERRDPGRASQLYRSLESGGDSWAKNALYARARLEASRGNHAEARRSLERYLERFPRGENAEDARAVLDRLR